MRLCSDPPAPAFCSHCSQFRLQSEESVHEDAQLASSAACASSVWTAYGGPGIKGIVSVEVIKFARLTLLPSYRLLSKLIFSWLDPFLSVGFSRPLQQEGVISLPVFVYALLLKLGHRSLATAGYGTALGVKPSTVCVGLLS